MSHDYPWRSTNTSHRTPSRNEFEDFYADMPRYALHSQVFFLAARLKQHLREVNPGRRVIQGRTVYEDAAIFARLLHDDGLMDDRDHASYRTLYHAVLATLSGDYSLLPDSAALGVGGNGINLGASTVALELLKKWWNYKDIYIPGRGNGTDNEPPTA